MKSMTVCTGIVFLLLPITLWAADLQVKVEGLDNENGFVNVALFDSEANFLKTNAALSGQRLKASLTLSTRFAELKPGTYAISIYHDANSNGKLDKNLLGMPTEPYGFSNNARGIVGPPSFDKAAFTFEKAGHTITITLR